MRQKKPQVNLSVLMWLTEAMTVSPACVFFCSCCLAGRAYPLGDIPEDLVVQVKHQVCRSPLVTSQWAGQWTPNTSQDKTAGNKFTYLHVWLNDPEWFWGPEMCSRRCFIADRFGLSSTKTHNFFLLLQMSNFNTQESYNSHFQMYLRAKSGPVFCCQVFEFLIRRHSADSSEEEEVFPFIRTLLHFDTREFLNVLAMVRVSLFTCVVLDFLNQNFTQEGMWASFRLDFYFSKWDTFADVWWIIQSSVFWCPFTLWTYKRKQQCFFS